MVTKLTDTYSALPRSTAEDFATRTCTGCYGRAKAPRWRKSRTSTTSRSPLCTPPTGITIKKFNGKNVRQTVATPSNGRISYEMIRYGTMCSVIHRQANGSITNAYMQINQKATDVVPTAASTPVNARDPQRLMASRHSLISWPVTKSSTSYHAAVTYSRTEGTAENITYTVEFPDTTTNIGSCCVKFFTAVPILFGVLSFALLCTII